MLYSRNYEKDKTLEVYVVKDYVDRDGCMNLVIRVEEVENRDHYSEWRLPDIFCYKSYGFSENEEFKMQNYLTRNEAIIWDDWREAKSCHKP